MRWEPGRVGDRRRGMRSKAPYLLLILAAIGLLLAACGGGTVDAGSGSDDSASGEGDAADGQLDGRWTLRDATIDGVALQPVDGLPITLEIAGDRIGGSAGCNSYGGTFTVDGTAIGLEDVSITEMACMDNDAMSTEMTFMDGLWRTDTVEVVGDDITLSGEGVSLVFVALPEVADTVLIGTLWTLDTLLDGDAASSTFNGVDPATIELDADGGFTASTGCRTIDGDYSLDGDRLQLTFEGEDFGCQGPAGEQDVPVMAVLEQPTTVSIDENRLTLMADDGTGLSYRAETDS